MSPYARISLRWLLRALAVLALLLVLLLALSPWAVPSLLRREIPRLGQQHLGRVVRVGSLSFNPILLRLRVQDLQVLDAAGHADALRLAQGSVRLDWSSLWGLHARLGEVRLQGLQLRVVRDADGHLDFEDILRRMASSPSASSGGTPGFAIDAFDLSDGSLRYEDQASGLRTNLRKLQFQLTQLSTLGSADGALHASARGLLDGAPLSLRLSGKVFGASPLLHVDLQLDKLALAQWAALQPKDLPVRLTQGSLDTTLHMQWALHASAGPEISGHVDIQHLGLERSGQALAQVRSASLDLISVLPLQHRLRLGQLRIEGLQARLDRSELGAPPGRATAPATPAASTPAASSPAASSPAAHGTPGAAHGTRAAVTGKPATAPATAPAPWRVELAGASLRDAQLQWHDASVRPVVDWTLRMPLLSVGPVQWPLPAANAGKPVQASAQLLGPQGLSLSLQASADAARADATLQLQGLDPQLALPYAQTWLHGAPLPSGVLQAQARLSWTGHGLHAALAQAQWKDFSWQPTGADAGQGPRAKAIVLRDASLDWSSRPSVLRIDAGALDVEQPSLGGPAGMHATALQLRQARVDLQSRSLSLGSAALVQPRAALSRDSSGAWSVQHLLPAGLLPASKPATKPGARGAPHATQPADARPWEVQVADASIRGGTLGFADTHAARPVVLYFSGIDAELHHAAWPMREAAGLSLQAHVLDARQAPLPTRQEGAKDSGEAAGALVRLQGQLRAAPWRLQGRLHAQGLPVQVAGDYLPRVNARVVRGTADADGSIDVSLPAGGPRLGFDGRVALEGLALNTLQPDASLLGWRSLQLQSLRLRLDPAARPATRLDIGQVLLHSFYARLTLSPQARLNVAEVLRPAGPASSASSGSSGATAPSASPASAAPAGTGTTARPGTPALRLRIGGITLDGGRINWADHFVQPNYSASLGEVHGSIGAFASDSPQQATVDLRAVAEGTAPVTLTGKVNPLLSPPQLDVNGRVDDLQLAPLSPYSTRYAGYGIERGLLSMNVHYDIDAGGKLEADNKLVLRQLTFGPHVDSPTATKLPVLLAVNLLKDPNGNINLDIPISGSLNDPHFSLGAVIAQAVGKLILRAITAPFSLMAHMFAGAAPPPQLNVVPFAAGQAQLGAADATRLADIARLLQAKPQLVVTITGGTCGASEAKALRQAVLERRLLQAWRRDLPRAEAYAHAKDTQVPAKYRDQALAELYRSTSLPDKPRNALGLARSVSPQTMQDLLLQSIPDGKDQLQALAMRRAIALREALSKLGVPAARQFIAAPETLGAGASGCSPSARLSVSLP